MPIYEFRGESSRRVVEEIFSIKDAPLEFEMDGERFVRIPSRPGVVDPLGKMAERRAEERSGIVPLESGMKRDMNEARIRNEKKTEENRRKIIADTLASF